MRAVDMPDPSRPTVSYFCIGALFVFVGSVLLCALGFTIVLPFEATRFWPKVSAGKTEDVVPRPLSAQCHVTVTMTIVDMVRPLLHDTTGCQNG